MILTLTCTIVVVPYAGLLRCAFRIHQRPNDRRRRLAAAGPYCQCWRHRMSASVVLLTPLSYFVFNRYTLQHHRVTDYIYNVIVYLIINWRADNTPYYRHHWSYTVYSVYIYGRWELVARCCTRMRKVKQIQKLLLLANVLLISHVFISNFPVQRTWWLFGLFFRRYHTIKFNFILSLHCSCVCVYWVCWGVRFICFTLLLSDM